MPLKVKVYNQEAEVVGEQDLPEDLFALSWNDDLIHQAVVTYLANQRQPIAHTKTRAEVRGGGRKPWRQKGTGRARAGSIRSPIWRGGGVTFGPRSERNFKLKLNKKMKRKALFIALSAKVKDNCIAVVDSLQFNEYKTKKFAEMVKNFEQKVFKLKEDEKPKRSLIVVNDKNDKKVLYSGRNLAGVEVINLDNINIFFVLKYRNLIITQKAMQRLAKKD